MIQTGRKQQISKLAGHISNEFADKNLTLLDDIAKFEGVPIHYDDYEDAFDGMLLYDSYNKNFHIHINVENGNSQNSKRGRFTLAHELGHFFLDEHRLGLKYGLLEPHGSFYNVKQKTLIELEADYFASCLLMPENKFKNFSTEYKRLKGKKNFSFDTIFAISDSFQTSILSTLIRFSEVGTHEIFAVISINNVVKWFIKSSDFPKWKLKFKIGETVPKTSLAGEYYSKENGKYSEIETLSADDWFVPSGDDNRANRQMYEQCLINNGFVVSLLWFD